MTRAVFVYQTSHPRGDGAVLLPPVRAFREERALRAAGWETETVEVARTPAPPVGRLWGRIAHFRRATRGIVDRLAAVGERPDLLVAHDIETLPAALEAGRAWSAPVVYDSHEHWPFLIRENSRVEAAIADILERRLVRGVSHVVVPSGSIAARFEGMGVPATVLYNARPMSEIGTVPRDEARRALRFLPGDFVMGFIGNTDLLINHDVPLYDILGAMERLPENVYLAVVGGPEPDQVKRMAWSFHLNTRVRVYGPRPYGELAPYYSALDLGLVPLSDIPIHNVSLGNKQFDYMARGIPLLAPGTAVDTAELIRKTVCGWTYGPETLLPVLRGIVRAPQECQKRGELGRFTFQAALSWDVQAPKWVKIAEGLCR